MRENRIFVVQAAENSTNHGLRTSNMVETYPIATRKSYLHHMRLLLLITTLLLAPHGSQAQSFGLEALFRPGLRMGATISPAVQVDDSINFQLSNYRMGLIVPIGGQLSLDIKDLKASAHQHFWTLNAGVRQVELEGIVTDKSLYNFTTGVTGAFAGTGKGIWGYTANVGIVQSFSLSDEYNPFFIGGIAKIKIRGIHKQDYYGLLAVYSGARFFPLPIIGFRRKLFEGAHLNLLLPIQADIDYKPHKNIQFVLRTGFGGFRTWMEVDSTAAIFDEQPLAREQAVLAFGNITSALEFRYRFNANFKLILEGGYFAPARLSLRQDQQTEHTVFSTPAVPYGRIAFRYNFGKAPINAQLFGNDL